MMVEAWRSAQSELFQCCNDRTCLSGLLERWKREKTWNELLLGVLLEVVMLRRHVPGVGGAITAL